MWDIGREVGLHTLRGSDSEVDALAFSPGGRLLASGDGDGVIRLWDPVAGMSLGELRVGGWLGHIQFAQGAPAELSYATFLGGRIGTVDLDPAALRHRLCALPDHTLTRREWRTFTPGRPYRPPCKP